MGSYSEASDFSPPLSSWVFDSQGSQPKLSPRVGIPAQQWADLVSFPFGLSGPEARAQCRGQLSFKPSPRFGGHYLSQRSQTESGTELPLAGLSCVWLVMSLGALEVNKRAATADRGLVCERENEPGGRCWQGPGVNCGYRESSVG